MIVKTGSILRCSYCHQPLMHGVRLTVAKPDGVVLDSSSICYACIVSPTSDVIDALETLDLSVGPNDVKPGSCT